MKISEMITDKYKLRIPPTVYYDLLSDVVEVEEEQEPKTGEWIDTNDGGFIYHRLKADMLAMLTDIQLEIEEKFNDRPFSYNHHQRTEFYCDIDEIIQQKINSLKEAKDG